MSDKFIFEYELHDAGWATARIRDGMTSVDMSVSYLRDSLRELADAVIAISRGSKESRVVFMDEPGEFQLTLTGDRGSDCSYALHWFNDWDSWGIRSLPGSKKVCVGTVSVRRLVHQVYSCLWTIQRVHGVDGYRQRWGQHDFPMNQMQRLVDLRV